MKLIKKIIFFALYKITILVEFFNEFFYKYKILNLIKTKNTYTILDTKYKHTFFGYYDKTPFNGDNTIVLAMATDYDNCLVSPQEAAVGYFDISSKKFFEVDKTTTWCWQQGCRQMWFDNNSFIYNKVVNDKYASVIYSIKENKIIRVLDFPIYDKSDDNKLALSLNFSRLQYFRPGYGYCNYLKEDDKVKIMNDDGIFLCDLELNTKKMIISLKTIISTNYDERMSDANHYINHLKFSPDNKHFIFYHIWNKNKKRFTRIIYSDIEGNIIRVLDNKTFMSHDTFINNNELLVYTKTHRTGYYLFNFITEKSSLVNKNIYEDGHPSVLNNDKFLTDTYPLSYTRKQRLLVFNNDSLKIIGEYYSPIRYRGEMRCDLHPRLSKDKSFVSIDLPTFEGRKLLIQKMEEVV